MRSFVTQRIALRIGHTPVASNRTIPIGPALHDVAVR